jgi:hypothetical protein
MFRLISLAAYEQLARMPTERPSLLSQSAKHLLARDIGIGVLGCVGQCMLLFDSALLCHSPANSTPAAAATAAATAAAAAAAAVAAQATAAQATSRRPCQPPLSAAARRTSGPALCLSRCAAAAWLAGGMLAAHPADLPAAELATEVGGWLG